jgi:hypothetical protein
MLINIPFLTSTAITVRLAKLTVKDNTRSYVRITTYIIYLLTLTRQVRIKSICEGRSKPRDVKKDKREGLLVTFLQIVPTAFV